MRDDAEDKYKIEQADARINEHLAQNIEDQDRKRKHKASDEDQAGDGQDLQADMEVKEDNEMNADMGENDEPERMPMKRMRADVADDAVEVNMEDQPKNEDGQEETLEDALLRFSTWMRSSSISRASHPSADGDPGSAEGEIRDCPGWKLKHQPSIQPRQGEEHGGPGWKLKHQPSIQPRQQNGGGHHRGFLSASGDPRGDQVRIESGGCNGSHYWLEFRSQGTSR